MRQEIATTAYSALILALCGLGSARAATALAPGVYDIGNVTYQFSSQSCPYIAERFLGATNTSDDGYLYFPGMGLPGARIEFPIWMWPSSNGINPAPYAPGVVTLHLPKAPAKSVSKWSGTSTMDYKPVLGITGDTEAPFGPQAWSFSFSLTNVTEETSSGEITISFANGCTFYLGNIPGQPISPILLRRVGGY